jgi:hypothetical protein
MREAASLSMMSAKMETPARAHSSQPMWASHLARYSPAVSAMPMAMPAEAEGQAQAQP